MNTTPDKFKPQPGWLLCRALKPQREQGKLIVPVDDTVTVSEGVAEILAAPETFCDQPGMKGGRGLPFPNTTLAAGDKVIYRGFLRFVHQLGEVLGAQRDQDIFLLHYKDVLARLEGAGTYGLHNEYVLE